MTRLASWQDFGTHDESAYPELWRGCVGAWAPCLGPTGLRLHDLSVYHNWGTLTNMDAATDWVVNGGRYALDLDGVNDYLLVASPSIGLSDYTIAAFFQQVTAATAFDVTCPSNIISTNTTGYTFPRIAIRETAIQISIDPRGAYQAAFAGDSLWHHIALVRRLGVTELYLDGRQLSLSSTGTNFDQSGYNFTGATFFVARINLSFLPLDFYTAGRADNIHIYNRALPPAEIRTLATRRGIAYERRKRRSVFFNAEFFNPAWARNSNVIISPVGAA